MMTDRRRKKNEEEENKSGKENVGLVPGFSVSGRLHPAAIYVQLFAAHLSFYCRWETIVRLT